MWERLREGVARSCVADFLRVLLLTVSAAEWCVLWWLCPALPWPVHLVGPVGVYTGNWFFARWTYRRRLARQPMGVLPRCYCAVAFTSLFCAAFLIVTGAAWLAAKMALGALTAEAWTTQTVLAVDSGLDAGCRWLAHAGMALIVIALTYGYTVGQARLRVSRLRLSLARFDAALNELGIVHISDIHIGHNLRHEELEGFVTRINELRPDILCITGDIIDSRLADYEGSLPILARLHARFGVFAILGNHDHHAGADRVEAAFRRLTAFTVLRDQYVTIRIKGHPLHIVGLDDRERNWPRGVPSVPYLTAVLTAIPSDEPVLLLSHRPDVFPQAAAGGVALTLSGHTHGGQIGVPWFDGRTRNLAEFLTAFDRGLYERDGCYLYVNCGLGVTGQRIRLSTPREITVIEVQADTVAAADGVTVWSSRSHARAPRSAHRGRTT